MTTTTTDTHAGTANTTPAAIAPASPRHDIYRLVHQALRLCMAQTLTHLGAMDANDPEALGQRLPEVESLLGLMRSHLGKENKYIHPALEARQSGTSQRMAAEHAEHEQAIAALADEVADLWASSPAQRDAQAHQLYHRLALFTAHNLEHMHYEETVHNAALWRLYSDAELQALEGQIIASIAPQEMMLWLRWMAAAATPRQLLALMAGMQAGAPPEAFAAALDVARQHISTPRWLALAQDLGVPQVMGLVDYAAA